MTTIQNRRGPAAAWGSANPILASGEFGFESDTGGVKIGDGTTQWLSLPYIASDPVSAPAVHYVDRYGADPTGVTSSDAAVAAARTALGTSPGVIVFGVGTYLLTEGLNAANGTIIGLNQGVKGQGASLTKVKYTGEDACFEFRNTAWEFNTASQGGDGISGIWIEGWDNLNTDVYAIRYGDIGKMRISDVHIVGFNNAGDVGIYGDNQVGWSERANLEASVEQCTTCFLFEGCLPNAANSYSSSFDYSRYEFKFVAIADQDAFVLRGKPGGMRTSMNGVYLGLTGNCQLAANTQDGALFRIGLDNDDEAAFTGELYINVETSGDGNNGEAHHDFMMGGAGPFWEVNSRVSAFGTINLIPYSGSNFKVGTAHVRNFAFAGLLKKSPTFGSTTNSQAFQPLQLVSQARGEYWVAPTNAVQMVYIEEATAGTFRLSYDSVLTDPIPYNATPSDVQAALVAIPALTDNVTVVDAQARFANGLYKDEIGFGVDFTGTLVEQTVPVMTVDTASLTGTAEVVVRNTGSVNKTLTARIETGNIVMIGETPGTYRLGLDTGNLTDQVGVDRDSPFGLFGVDIWIKQPTTGGNVVLEGPYFVPKSQSGSTYSFQWLNGIEPVLSTAPDAFDVIRISTYNFNVWIGQHITRQTIVPVPASVNSPGITGQRATDGTYEYVCIATDTWRRTELASWGS